MTIEFTDGQFELLKEIVRDYTDYTYETILDYNRCAMEAEEDIIRDNYKNLAEGEEEKYNAARKLRAYLDLFE